MAGVLGPNRTGSASTVPIVLDEFSFNADVSTLDPGSALLDSVQHTVFTVAIAVKDGAQIAYVGITGKNYEFAMME